MPRLALTLILATLAGCSLLFPSDGAPDSPPVETVLFSGTSYGECIGYCITDLTIEGRSAVLVYSGWERDTPLPDLRYERRLSASERARLDRAFDRAALRRADPVYGCPDCADGGAEWIGASWDGGEKRVTFEAGREVRGLVDFIVAMRDLRASFPSPGD